MPIIASAKKKMRKDKKRTAKNLKYISNYKETLKMLKKGGKSVGDLISKYYSQVDKAVKENIIHKNKGKRLKSKVGKFVTKK